MAQVTQISFLGPIPLGQIIFQDLIILLHLTYDYGENEVLFVKIAARVLSGLMAWYIFWAQVVQI